MADELQQVAIRMVEQPPLYSNEPMNNPDAAIRVMNDFLAQMDRELFCIVNLQAVHIAKLIGRVCGAKWPHSVSKQPISTVFE